MDKRQQAAAHRQRIAQAHQVRRVKMVVLRDAGWTLDRIGRRYGITRQRVHAILKNGG